MRRITESTLDEVAMSSRQINKMTEELHAELAKFHKLLKECDDKPELYRAWMAEKPAATFLDYSSALSRFRDSWAKQFGIRTMRIVR